MRARYSVRDPDKVVFAMTIEMTAGEWCELRDQLAQKWPSSELSNKITALLSDARRIFWSEQEP